MEDKKGSMTGCENQIDDQRIISQFLPCENSIMYENCDHESIGELALGQSGNFNSTKIYHSLTSREWNTIGYFDPEIVDSSSLTEIMIDHIVSILFHHVTKLPAYESNAEPSTSSVVKFQLRNLVVAIEDSYEQNHFHSFNHAYQVVVSMNKLIDEITRDPPSKTKTNLFFQDPLFAFSLVFGALIHDVGHTGMSNQILKEQHHSLCDIYNHHDESIAERYSLDLAIKIFNLNEFNDLRNTILPDSDIYSILDEQCPIYAIQGFAIWQFRINWWIFTGRFRGLAVTEAAHETNVQRVSLPPKPPPMRLIFTITFNAGVFVVVAQYFCVSVGFCIDA